MKDEPIPINDPQLTAYALGELTPAEKAQFENNLADSPEARVELEDIKETIHWVRDGLASELNSHPVSAIDIGNPMATAFALNEVSPEDGENFKALLKSSPEAREELANVEETIGWLEEAFGKEIATPRLMVETAGESEEKIVTFDFKQPGIRVMLGGLAAVLVAMVGVGAFLSGDRGAPATHHASIYSTQGSPNSATFEKAKAPVISDDAIGNVVLAGVGADSDSDLKIPQLFLKKELSDYNNSYIPVSTHQPRQLSLPQDPTSYIDFEEFTIEPMKMDSFTSLPGIGEIGKGEPHAGYYKFRNAENAQLPDDEYGYGNLSFKIQKKEVNGKSVEIIRLIDTRRNPDGSTKTTEKEYIREGDDVGKPIESLLQTALGPQGNIIGGTERVTDPVSVLPTVPGAPSVSTVPVISEFSAINVELISVRDALAKNPTGDELNKLQLRLTELIDRQQAVAEWINGAAKAQ